MTTVNPPATSVDNPLANVRVVLVHTTHPGNIGSVARAIKNMGMSQLYLVKPKNFPHERAGWRAASAGDILENAVVVETLDEAIADCGLVVGSSARGRKIPWPMVDPRSAAQRMLPELDQHPVAMVFGREDRGLTNEELQRCNLHVNIPASEDYSSLNLGMAVQVVTYELRMAYLARKGLEEAGSGVAGEAIPGSMPENMPENTLETKPETKPKSGNPAHDYTPTNNEMQGWDTKMARAEDIERYFVHLEETLIEMGFLKPAAPKQLMTRLRRIYARTRLDDLEVNMMRGILTATQQWVRKARDKDQ